jgi:hypothetical protein
MKNTFLDNSKLIGPSIFFVLGFIYYFFTPYLALTYYADNEHMLSALIWIGAELYDKYYLYDGLIILASWFLGYYLIFNMTKARESFLDSVADKKIFGKLLATLVALFTLILAADAILGGASFFSGYADYNILVLGPFATMAFSAILLRSFFIDSKIRLYFALIFLFCAFILIGLGSRMSVMLSLVAAALDYYYRHKIKVSTALSLGLFISLATFLMLAVGVVRDGGEISFESLMGVLFAEPTFTSISAVRFLQLSGERPVFGVPYDVLVGIVNFIPSIIFPGKIEFIENFSPSIHFGHNPFGANALLSNLYMNFGYFYPLFIIFVGGYYAYLHKRAFQSRIFKSIYISSLPLLLFYIHREGFVTLIKVMFFNSSLLPIIIMYFLYNVRHFGLGSKIKTH